MPHGRTDKGRARRAVILAAAAEVALSEGLAAVTHRATAERAGVALGATTYYFSSREDLLVQALRVAADQELARARAAAAKGSRRRDPAVALAVSLLDVTVGLDRLESPELSAYYERMLEAGRSAPVAAVVRQWNAGLREVIADVLAAAATQPPLLSARTALALVDGYVVGALGEATLRREPIITALADALRPLLSPPRRPDGDRADPLGQPPPSDPQRITVTRAAEKRCGSPRGRRRVGQGLQIRP